MPKAMAPKPKTNWRQWMRLGILSVFILCGLFGARQLNAFLEKDSRFELLCRAGETACATLEIRGAVHADQSRIRKTFEQDFGQSVFRIPMAERRRHLVAVDWVDQATIARLWPNRIVVTVTERKPVAFAKLPVGDASQYRMGLIDAEGVLLPIPARVRFHLPVVSGVNELQTEAERKARVAVAQRLLSELGSQGGDVSEVNAADKENLKLIADIGGQAVELWMGNERFLARYGHFVNHYTEIRERAEGSGIFDLRLDDRILAK